MIKCAGGCGKVLSGEPDIEHSMGVALSCGKPECNEVVGRNLRKHNVICMACGKEWETGHECGAYLMYVEHSAGHYLDCDKKGIILGAKMEKDGTLYFVLDERVDGKSVRNMVCLVEYEDGEWVLRANDSIVARF